MESNNNKRAVYLRKITDDVLAIIDKHREEKSIKTKTEAVIDIVKKYPMQQIVLEKQRKEIQALQYELDILREHFESLENIIAYIKSK
ncbi:hypothetical protein NWE55_16620 (plasmid) [Myroides albus]|uniref:Uncharacterized protein n=1 Tax=Myroides odoratimimus TaxID=76832 RepID=A0AAI8C9C7_9FLAO|nr:MULTISPECIES: hypothetical protein [Myroides]ALU28449.1 hypothetical protein AS202_19910 [Myroides odoratimimus]UVD81367.1 hypothetical protein NWE55_16980 [Myroides albus]UVD81385.1 hypothetical protein NWE55_16620 [Myroides albus]